MAARAPSYTVDYPGSLRERGSGSLEDQAAAVLLLYSVSVLKYVTALLCFNQHKNYRENGRMKVGSSFS